MLQGECNVYDFVSWEWVKRMNCQKRAEEMWKKFTIKNKIGIFIGVTFFMIGLSILFGFWIVQFFLGDFRVVLEDNVKSNHFMEAMELETKTFLAYIKEPSERNYTELEEACKRTRNAVENLPFSYEEMSPKRYAKTWSVRNSYAEYERQRNHVLRMSKGSVEYIKKLYEIYNMQIFLQEYARKLMRYTLEDENVVYLEKAPVMKSFPVTILIIGGFLFWSMINLARILYRTIVYPIYNMAEASKKIAANDFLVDDVINDSKDEIGELVKAFNKMKYATGEYILTLEEKRTTLDLLHKEELERLKIEKQMEAIQLDLLKSQIDPHFLFNTLNVIGGMANLEDAVTTEKMIKALSSIFRYNLKMRDSEVNLKQELCIVKDYIYIQQMRFGNRIQFRIDCPIELETAIVPAFSFQPLVENAILHGLSKKEEGGKVVITVKRKMCNLEIYIADTGIGMTEEKLREVRTSMQAGHGGAIGIGLGNIYKRILGLYKTGELEINSKWREGTTILLSIPQVEWGEARQNNVQSTDCR